MYRNYRNNNNYQPYKSSLNSPFKQPSEKSYEEVLEQPFAPPYEEPKEQSREQSYSQCHNKQKHVHEIQGSVQIAEPQEDPHNHRFATVSDEAIPLGPNDHYHEVKFRTDFYENHYHEFCGKTSGAIPVGNRHVHFIKSFTSVNDGHKHNFRVATLIDDPIGENCK